MTKVEDQNS